MAQISKKENWLAPTVVGVAILAITLILFVQRTMIRDFDRNFAVSQLAERIQRDVSRVHLWFEEALAADNTINLDRDVRRPLEATIQAVAQKLGESRGSNWGTETLSTTLNQLLQEMQSIRHAVDDRWLTRGESGRTGGEKDQEFDRSYERILLLGDQLHQESTRLASAQRQRLTRLNVGVLGLVLSLFLALALMISRTRKSLQAKNLELEVRVEERTRDLRRTNSNLEEARDAAEAASRTRSEFLANMSHEIRTPLNIVLGTSSLLLADEGDRGRRSRLQAILDSGDDLLRMLDDALQIARGQLTQIELNSERVSLEQLVRSAVGFFADPAKKAGIRIEVVAEALPEVVADRARLRQVLINLLSNALKFADKGTITVSVRGETEPSEADSRHWFEVQVADQGPGVPDEARARIFAPFEQLDGSTTRSQEGVGLGLAICKQVIDLFEGQIGVRDAHPHGAVFWFRLPLELVSPATDTPSNSQDGQRLLVVDDNPLNGRLAVDLLAQLGYRAEWVASGSELLERLKSDVLRSEIRGLLLDCLMPEMDGYEVARQVRALSETLPILALTARVGPGERDRVVQAGMNDYLDKPLTLAKLGPFLARWIRPDSEQTTDSYLTPPPSDTAPANSLASMRPELVAELVQIYEEEMPAQARSLLQQVGQRDYAAIQSCAHRMRSSAEHLGRVALSKRLELLEGAAQQRDQHAILDLTCDLDSMVRESCESLRDDSASYSQGIRR